jgi:hypothetical protein
MKYMIMTFRGTSGLEGKSPEWIKKMIELTIEPYGWDRSRATSGYSSAGP